MQSALPFLRTGSRSREGTGSAGLARHTGTAAGIWGGARAAPRGGFCGTCRPTPTWNQQESLQKVKPRLSASHRRHVTSTYPHQGQTHGPRRTHSRTGPSHAPLPGTQGNLRASGSPPKPFTVPPLNIQGVDWPPKDHSRPSWVTGGHAVVSHADSWTCPGASSSEPPLTAPRPGLSRRHMVTLTNCIE